MCKRETALLRVEALRVLYGRREALVSVSLEVPAGSVSLLTGRNGAGKSTLLKAVFGAVLPTDGHILFDGEEITGAHPHKNACRGVAYLAQGGVVFPELTVTENLEVARLYPGHSPKEPTGLTQAGSSGSAGEDRAVRSEEALRAFQNSDTVSDASTTEVLNLFPVLRGLMNRAAGLLSGGERQMLGLGMCLSRNPRLLLLDEPTAGLAEDLARQALDCIRKTCEATGCAVLLAEQNVAEARRITDVEYVLASGSIVSTIRLRRSGGEDL